MSANGSSSGDTDPKQVHNDIIKDLSLALEEVKERSTYACGGKLVLSRPDSKVEHKPEGKGKNKAFIKTDAANSSKTDNASLPKKIDPLKDRRTAATSNQDLIHKPVTIRFGPQGAGQILTLPLAEVVQATLSVSPNKMTLKHPQPLQSLLKACQPASFGVGGEEVLDDTYRKALKMDTSDFCTDFCPYDSGIIDIVNQLLMPSINEWRGVKAELYKLNVYSGPSGHFKAHVDTPRSDTQIGSLVVVLPCAFEGGQLAVRSAGNETLFDWSPASASTIQWAAFYSDCEHEVMSVTSGHRITVTYNLYLDTGIGLLTGGNTSLRPTQIPIYDLLRTALGVCDFMRHGGTLGVYFNHAYPHTHKIMSRAMPRCLKGVDMAIYEAVRALKLKPKVVAIKKATGYEYYSEDDDFYDDYGVDSDGFEIPSYGPVIATYTKVFRPVKIYQEWIGDEGMPGNPIETTTIRDGEVTWLTQKKHIELAEAFVAYGNSPSMGVTYTAAAMLISIPNYIKRHKAGMITDEDFDDGASVPSIPSTDSEDRYWREFEDQEDDSYDLYSDEDVDGEDENGNVDDDEEHAEAETEDGATVEMDAEAKDGLEVEKVVAEEDKSTGVA